MVVIYKALNKIPTLESAFQYLGSLCWILTRPIYKFFLMRNPVNILPLLSLLAIFNKVSPPFGLPRGGMILTRLN